MLLVVLMVLTVGTLLCAVSSSIGLLIIGRVIQGIGGGIFPLAFGIIRDEFPRDRVAGASGWCPRCSASAPASASCSQA